MANEDFGDFTVEVEHRPVGGVTQGDIPEALAKLLAEKASKALANPQDFELVLRAKDEATAKRLAGYARAWGSRQTPKLYITKQPNGKRYEGHVARLKVQKDEEVPPENRTGRRPQK